MGVGFCWCVLKDVRLSVIGFCAGLEWVVCLLLVTIRIT